ETDKATMEYEAIDEGTLAKIVVPEGTQDVPVNALIAVLAEEGEDVKAAAAAAGKQSASAAKHEPVTPKPAPTAKPAPSAPAPIQARPQPDAGGAAAHHEPRSANRIFSSPLARRLAKEVGIDLAGIAGSGPHGRIIARDVEAARSGRTPARPTPAGA